MISKKTLKTYNFENIAYYYDYIIDSYTNGQKKQSKELKSKLSKKQALNFLIYLDSFCLPMPYLNHVLKYTI